MGFINYIGVAISRSCSTRRRFRLDIAAVAAMRSTWGTLTERHRSLLHPFRSYSFMAVDNVMYGVRDRTYAFTRATEKQEAAPNRFARSNVNNVQSTWLVASYHRRCSRPRHCRRRLCSPSSMCTYLPFRAAHL